jgi:homoserine dehydrogenase
MQDEVIVLKFGSSVLRTREDIPNAVHEIYRWYRAGTRVLAVVSAIGDTTDRLLAEARELAAAPEPYATAELLATGERISAALMGLALDRAGIPGRVLNPREIELTVSGSALDAELVAANTDRVQALLKEHAVLVVPGFFGTDTAGRTHLLGRGGSDLSAVFLARILKARCRLIKDVDGVYERDPALRKGDVGARLCRFASLNYAAALRVAAALIQPKAVSFLRQYQARAEVAATAHGYETIVHGGDVQLAEATVFRPLRVLLLGLGTVGLGVYERLFANPQHFQVVGALVRDRGKYERLGVPGGLLRSRVDQIIKLRADIVVDALPGLQPSQEIVEHFLSIGTNVVSAGKALIAECGTSLTAVAERSGAKLCYSAAVGGSSPMIEAAERIVAAGSIASIAGVLNGTCNFVLDRCGRGEALQEALAEARRAGFAEADASEDLSGADAGRKICVVARRAFDAEVRLVELQRLNDATADWAQEVAAHGLRLRQVCRAARCHGEVRATVGFEAVPADSVFGRLRDEWNALQILEKDGAVQFITGRGAGRWPTTEAILGDLFQVWRELLHSEADRCAGARLRLGA